MNEIDEKPVQSGDVVRSIFGASIFVSQTGGKIGPNLFSESTLSELIHLLQLRSRVY